MAYTPTYVPKPQWVSDTTVIEATDMKQIDDVIVSVENALKDVVDESALNKSNVTALTIQVSGAESNINAANDNIRRAENDIRDLQSSVSSIGTRMDTAESNITSLTSRVEALEGA